MFIINLNELNFRELFEVLHQRARDGIERAIRLTITTEIHVRHAIGKCQFGVACETIEHQGESLVAFDIARTFEKLIEDSADQIL